MKKWILWLTLLAMLILPASALAETVKIGLITPDGDHGFTGESIAHAKKEIEAQEAKLDAEFLYLTGDANQQIEAIKEMIAWAPDALVLWPMDGEQLREAAQSCLDAGIKLVLYDRLIEDFEGKSAEIMGDNELIGAMMGQYLIDHFSERLETGETIEYLEFLGDQSTVTGQRLAGMMDVLSTSAYTDQFVKVAEPFITEWNEEIGRGQMEEFLQSADPEVIAGIDLIVTQEDEVVNGVLTALESYEGEINLDLITGIGARRETLDALEKSDYHWVTYYFSPSYVREAIRLGVACALSEPYDGQEIAGQRFLLHSVEVDDQNVADYRGSELYAERYSID